jgi:hypothetical protein
LILCVAGLLLVLFAYGEGVGVERGVPAGPEKRAVGLVGLEIAEIAEAASTPSTSASAPAASATAASTEATTATETSSTATKAASATWTSAALSGTIAPTARAASGERLVQFRVLAELLHVHAGKGVGGACLTSYGD